MNKKLLIVGVVIIGLVIVGAIIFLGGSITTPTETPTVNEPGDPFGPREPIPKTVTNPDGTITITNSLGGLVQTKDFINDPQTTPDPVNVGYYYLGPNSIDDPVKKIPYSIGYIDETHFFNIVLLQEPIAETRKNAERYLLEHLGLSQSQMCDLRYMVGVPDRVNSTYTTMDLGFSFCPGSVIIPE